MTCECCDVGVQFRQWLLDIPEVADYVHGGDSIVDTIEENQKKPFIWYSASGGTNSDVLTECGSNCLMSEIFYDMEIVDDARYLARTRRIAEKIRQEANNWTLNHVSDPFGDPDAEFYVQMIEVNDVTDNYVHKCALFLPGIMWTSMNVEITPV